MKSNDSWVKMKGKMEREGRGERTHEVVDDGKRGDVRFRGKCSGNKVWDEKIINF